MPIYEYKREDGTTFETVHRMNEPRLDECPDTGQKVTLMISGGVTKPQIKPKTIMSNNNPNIKQKREENHTSLSEYRSIHERQKRRFEEKEAERKNKS